MGTGIIECTVYVRTGYGAVIPKKPEQQSYRLPLDTEEGWIFRSGTGSGRERSGLDKRRYAHAVVRMRSVRDFASVERMAQNTARASVAQFRAKRDRSELSAERGAAQAYWQLNLLKSMELLIGHSSKKVCKIRRAITGIGSRYFSMNESGIFERMGLLQGLWVAAGPGCNNGEGAPRNMAIPFSA